MVHAPVFDAVIAPAPADNPGLGHVRCERGELPLEEVWLHADIAGLAASVDLRARFCNRSVTAVEATYVFPLPELAAVTSLQIRTGATVIDGWLKERAQARDAYADSQIQRHRSAILEQEREDVVTIRVGTIAPGERVEVRLALHMRLSYVDGQIYFRFPLVVAPRHIPGVPFGGDRVGAGTGADTDLVPDGSRVSPPVRAGSNVRLSASISVAADAYAIDEIGCSLRTQITSSPAEKTIRIEAVPGQRPDRDLVLRICTTAHNQPSLSLLTSLDGDGREGTFALTILPPTLDSQPEAERDVVVLVDASASMSGWRLPAARRAASRIIDTLTPRDRFAVLSFADAITQPGTAGLVEATERNRFRAIEHLFTTRAAGNPLLLNALETAGELLIDPGRRSIIFVITAGQVGNEDQIATFTPRIGGVHIHLVGIGAAVNAGLLRQLAVMGRGQMLLAESEDALDDITPALRRQLGPPLLTNLSLAGDGMQLLANTIAPSRPPDVFSGSSVVITGRFRGQPNASMVVSGTGVDRHPWASRVHSRPVAVTALTQLWARAFLAELQQRYLRCPIEQAAGLEKLIVATSLRFGVLTRLTSFVALSNAPTGAPAAPPKVIQAVELPADWCEPESDLSPYAVEYARILGATRNPPASDTPAPPAAQSTQVRPTYADAPPPYASAAPPAAPPPWAAPPPRAAPQMPSAPVPSEPKPPRRSRGRYIGAGVAAATAAVTAGVLGSTIIATQNTATAPSPSSTVTSPPTRLTTTVEPGTGARLTATVTPQRAGSDIDVRVSGIPSGTTVRLVVVGRDGVRHQVDEWVVHGTSSSRRATTTLAPGDIASVAVEDTTGRVYVTAVPE